MATLMMTLSLGTSHMIKCNLEFDLSRSLNVKLDGTMQKTTYSFLLVNKNDSDSIIW